MHNVDVRLRTFSMTELLVVLAVIALLLAIVLPVFAQARERGRRTTCLSNLRQIGNALSTYHQDYDSYFPPYTTSDKDWAGVIRSYCPADEIFRCPTCNVPSVAEGWGDRSRALGYGINALFYDYTTKNEQAISEPTIRCPATTVSLCEYAYRTGSTSTSVTHPIALTHPDDGRDLEPEQKFIGSAGALRHGGGSNYAFVDGHVRWYVPSGVIGAKYGVKIANDGQHPSFGL